MAIQIKSTQLKYQYPFLTEGGEAKIYVYDKDYLLKIFKEHVNLQLKESKVDLWLKSRKINGFVSPVEKVYIDGKFQGYLMENIKDAEVIADYTKKKHIQLLNITNRDLVSLLLDASKKLELLHQENKVVGDISDRNNLVKFYQKGYHAYYIDCDSFGIGNFIADAYTEIFTDPKAYISNQGVVATRESDMYAFAILTFRILTRLHPFMGNYLKDSQMKVVDRMKQKISVLGNNDITIPHMIPSWNWMSPNLLSTMYEIFELDKRIYLTNDLQELYDHMKYCDKHQNFFYDKFNQCPICYTNAKVSLKPVVMNSQDCAGMKISMLLSNEDIVTILDFDKYVDKQGNLVHLTSKHKWKYDRNYTVEFSANGKYVFEIYPDCITIYEIAEKKKLATLQRAFKSDYVMQENTLFYIDEDYHLSQLYILGHSIAKSKIMSTYGKTLFTFDQTGNYFVAILYPKNMLIATKQGHIRIPYEGKIYEYVMKYDKVSKNWLFIYETNKGEHRTIVIGKNNVLFDSTMYRYVAEPLSNICFANNTIFTPSHQKIVGINYEKNVVKNFDLNLVTEESTLYFKDGGFDIISEQRIFHYGR